MSTYLLGFIVHEEYVAYTEPGSVISVYAAVRRTEFIE